MQMLLLLLQQLLSTFLPQPAKKHAAPRKGRIKQNNRHSQTRSKHLQVSTLLRVMAAMQKHRTLPFLMKVKRKHWSFQKRPLVHPSSQIRCGLKIWMCLVLAAAGVPDLIRSGWPITQMHHKLGPAAKAAIAITPARLLRHPLGNREGLLAFTAAVFVFLPKLLLLILFCFRNAAYSKIVALPTQPAVASVISSVRMSSRGRTIRPKVNFDSLPHHNNIDSPGTAAVPRSRLEKGTSNATLSTTNASVSKACDTGSSEQEYEDDVPLVCPILESRHATPSTPVNPMASSRNQSASVKRARTRCNELAEMQIGSCKKSVQFKGPVESDPVVPSIELSHMSFIVTNVSRCLPCLLLAATFLH
jgi:hypothetical protein